MFVSLDSEELVCAIALPEHVAESSGIPHVTGDVADPVHRVAVHRILVGAGGGVGFSRG